MSKIQKTKVKKGALVSGYFTTAATFFGLGYGYHDEIKDTFTNNPGMMWGLISSMIVVVLAGVGYGLFKKLTAPMRRKKDIQQLEKAKLEHELEQIAEAKKEKEQDNENKEEEKAEKVDAEDK